MESFGVTTCAKHYLPAFSCLPPSPSILRNQSHTTLLLGETVKMGVQLGSTDDCVMVYDTVGSYQAFRTSNPTCPAKCMS